MSMPPLLDRRRRLGLAAVAGLTLLQAVAAGAAAFATRSLFEAMHQGVTLPVEAVASLVGAGVAIAVTRVAARQLGERIGQDYARAIRTALFEHAAGMSARAAAARRAGYMSLRFVGDMTAFRNWLALGLPRLVAAVVVIPVLLVVLWLLDPAFALSVLPFLVPALVLITWGGRRLLPLQRRLRARRARIAAEMAERMPIAPFLDRLGRRRTETNRLDRRTDRMIAAALRHRMGVEGLKALPDVVAGAGAALVVVVGYRTGLSVGDIAAALAALGLLLAPLRDLGAVWNHATAHRVATTKVTVALSRAPRDLYRARKSLPKVPVKVEFTDVPLPSGKRLSFCAQGGETSDLLLDELDAAWVAEVLLGLDAPGFGQVRLSGVDLCDLSRGTLRRNVHLLGSEPAILQGSLRRALVMGCDSRPDDNALESIAGAAGLCELMARLGGLNGTVLEGGKNLTKGERLAIARTRILLMSPRLIILAPGISGDIETFQRGSRRRSTTVLRLHSLT